MQSRTIGRTKLAVTEYSFGGASLGNLYEAGSDDNARATLSAAWDAGMRYFDTAPHYGFGLSERRFGDFLRDKPRESCAVNQGRAAAEASTERPGSGCRLRRSLNFKLHYDYGYDAIMRSVEDSYQRLGLNRIDMLYVHDIGVYTHGVELTRLHLRQLFDGGLKALDELKSGGVIAAYGLGVNEVDVCLTVMQRAPSTAYCSPAATAFSIEALRRN